MGLRLIYGPANSGKTGKIYNLWLESLNKHEDPMLVLPTQGDVLRIKKELAQKKGCILGGSIITIGELFKSIVYHNKKELEEVSPFIRKLLLRAAIDNTALELLKSSAKHKGFVEMIGRTINEFLSNGVSPQQLKSHAKFCTDHLMAETAKIFEKYMNYLQALKLAEPRQIQFMAVEQLDNVKLHSKLMIFHKFEDFTLAQRALIEKLSENTEIIVTLPYEEKRKVFESVERSFAWLKGMAAETIFLKAAKNRFGSLHSIERNLFENKGIIADCEPVMLLEVAGIHNETELVASEISKLIKGKGNYKPNEIAVIARDPETYKYEIPHIFSLCGLPFSYRYYYSMNETAFGQAFLALLRYLLISSDIKDLLAFARSQFSPLDKNKFLSLEKSVLQGFENTALNNLHKYIGESFAENIFNIKSKQVDAEMLKNIATGMLRIYLKHKRQKEERFENDCINLAAFQSVVQGLDTLLKFSKINKNIFGDILSPKTVYTAIEGIEVETRQKPEDEHIQILSPPEARGRRFKAIFMLGLNEGNYPRRKPSDPFLPNDIRKTLRDSGLKNIELPTATTSTLEEMHLFYMLVTRASEKLYLSYRSMDDKGSHELRSYFLDGLIELFDTESLDELENKKLSKELKDVAFPKIEDCPNNKEILRKIALDGYMYYEHIPFPLINRLRPAKNKSLKPDSKNLRLSPSMINDYFEKKGYKISVSQITGYLDCHYKWFAGSMLKLQPLIEEFGFKHSGKIMHDIACKLYSQMPEETGEKLPSANTFGKWLDRARQLIENELASDEYSALKEPDRLIVRHELEHLLYNLLETDSKYSGPFQPGHLEKEFGKDSGLPALELPGFRYKITGKVDRIDTENTSKRAVVYDYKTGILNKAKRVKDMEKERDLQILIYKKAVENVFQEDLEVVRAFYRYPKTKVVSGLDFSDNDSVEFYKKLDQILENEVFKPISQGDLHTTSEKCDYCEYGLVCRKSAH